MRTVEWDRVDSGRCYFDFGVLTYSNGWMPINTKLDIDQFGIWTNPYAREVFTYCEGDTAMEKCDTDEEYVKALRDVANWYIERNYWLGIDPGFSAGMRNRLVLLGVSDLIRWSI